ncbi:MAG TPA: hypothetical protein EYQ66_11910 [Myxococcales bacterium]|nr:hypothetical protein [Myxococcales bacterium]
MLSDRFYVEFWAVLFLLPIIGCLQIPDQFVVISPEQGQLIRDAENFSVEIMVSSELFDPTTLEAEINGVSLTVSPGDPNFVASLPVGQTLDNSNQLVVSVLGWSDGVPRIRQVEFSMEPLSRAVVFSEKFVTEPPPIETAELQILHTLGRRQNAILHVTFRAGFDAPTHIPYRVDAQTVFVLSDSGLGDDEFAGDGLYTARVDFDFENFRTRKSRDLLMAALGEAGTDELQFSGRELVAKKVPNIGSSLASLASPMTISLVPAPPMVATVDSERALMVRDLSVVADPSRTFDPCDTDGDGATGDPNGAWSFKTLMGQMANTAGTGIPLDIFVRQWLAGWAKNFDPLNGGALVVTGLSTMMSSPSAKRD